MSAPLRCLSIDVEEYFQIEAARGVVARDRWYQWPTRVEACMDKLLALFDETGVRATLFILGHVAELHPQLVRRCADAGHEIASHGTWHDRLHRLNPQSFKEDVRRSRTLLEDITGRPVLGYRAPTWSITHQTAWAVDVLAELGFMYDASIFPTVHPQYGIPDAPTTPYFVRNGEYGTSLLEVPPLIWRTMGRNVPVAGGGYFRILPLALMKYGLEQAAEENRPAVLYFHPWEFDPDMPRLPLSITGRLRTYLGLKHSLDKLRHILTNYDGWMSIEQALPTCRAMAQQQPAFVLPQTAAA